MNAAVINVFEVSLPAQPYPGLRPFTKDEWPIFFGRERMTDEVIARLMHDRLLVVHGDSGCGKSSLIRAGVQPRLEQQFARGGDVWWTCSATPGDNPLANLADALASGHAGGDRVAQIHRILNRGRAGAAALADMLAAERSGHVCVLLDQFEELFAHARHHGANQASILADFLVGVHALGAGTRLRFVLTMRSEFLGACAHYDGFAQVVNDTQYLLPRMERADLLRAIQEPAMVFDGEVAPELAERMISDACGSQDQLPLIQHALMRLHAVVGAKPDWRLTPDLYPESGGLGKLLSDHADAVRDAVAQTPEARKVVEEMFRALTEINADHQAIRRPQTVAQLLAVTGADRKTLDAILAAFRAEGVSFVRPYGVEPLASDESVDISHEALIRCWDDIASDKVGWLTREFDDGLIWSALRVQCRVFEEDPKNVLSAATTEDRKKWMSGRNAEWARRYGGGWDRVEALIDASVVARRAQEKAAAKAARIKYIIGAWVVTAVLLCLAGFLFVDADRARQRAEEAYKEKAEALERADRSSAQLRSDHQLARSQTQELQAGITRLTREIEEIKAKAGATAGADFERAEATIAQIEQTNLASQISPRVYIHIAAESQRQAARDLELGIESEKFGDVSLIVPGVQLIKFSVPRPKLRCFVAADCKAWGDRLVKVVNSQLVSPKVELEDFSRTYTDTGAIRPLHFELYFPPGDIVTRRGLSRASEMRQQKMRTIRPPQPVEENPAAQRAYPKDTPTSK
jgi:hypothetical protein